MSDVRVGVVLATHNRVADLLHTLQRLQELPEEPAVVVVDNASTDGTGQLVRRRFPHVDLIRLERNAGAAARNVGVRRLERDYVAFCDDDTWWAAGALTRAADVLDAHSDVAVVNAHILVEPGGRDDPVCEELLHSPIPTPADAPGPHILSFLAGASVIRRRAFLAAGGFEERLQLGGEEALLACDLAARGWSLVHLPAAVVHHRPSPARDPHRRRRLGIRNALWFFWLRRPLLRALRRSAHLLRRAPADRHTAMAVAAAVAGIPWIRRERRVPPPAVERDLRLLDGPQMSSRARRYVS